MEQKEADQAIAVQVLMNVQQKKIESAALSDEARKLKEAAEKIDMDIETTLRQNTANGVLVPNKVYLVGTKGYIVRMENKKHMGLPSCHRVYIETVDVAYINMKPSEITKCGFEQGVD